MDELVLSKPLKFELLLVRWQMQETFVPRATAIRKTIERIVDSPDFEASERAARFLRYVVEETLQGRSDQIKAFSIGVDVFGRDESFDPQYDPAVRIEAARLRRALEHYYLLSGKNDPILIDIPKGSYVPTFAKKDTDGAAAPKHRMRSIRNRWWLLAPLVLVLILTAGWVQFRHLVWNTDARSVQLGPKILVLPFADLGNDDTSALYAAAITDELVGALAHFNEVAVFGVQTSRAVGGDDIANLREKLQADYVLEGSARTDDQTARVSARLIDTTSGAVRWSNIYEYRLSASELFRIPVETAAAVAGTVAQPNGILFNEANVSRLKKPPGDLEAYFCTLKYYVYSDTPTPAAHAVVRDCLEKTVAQFPGYATAWALLAYTVIDELRHRYNPRPEAAARALHAAREAIAIDPENARAHQAMATAHFYSGNAAEAFDAAERALALNPNDSDLLGQLGQIFGLAGQEERARELLGKALILNPGQADFNQLVLALVCYTQHDYVCAKTAIEKSEARQVPTYYGVAAMTYAQLGLDEKARASLADFNRIAPDFVPNLWAELSNRNIPFDNQLHIAEGLEKAGAKVPLPPEQPPGKQTTPAG
jgi:adenylate cyclase